MPTQRFPLGGKREWRVLFRDKGKWLLGVYRPKFTARSQISKLEKHAGPELFSLVKGKVNLVLKEKGRIKEVALRLGEAVVTDTWHNGYRPGGEEGICLVIERDGNPSRYLRLNNRST